MKALKRFITIVLFSLALVSLSACSQTTSLGSKGKDTEAAKETSISGAGEEAGAEKTEADQEEAADKEEEKDQSDETETEKAEEKEEEKMAKDFTVAEGYVYSEEKTNFVDILMENGSHMVVELYPDLAPITVENFQDLVSKNFYDGIIFHRVIKGFMIQGGDPDGVGTGGSGKHIKGEFASNGVENKLRHERGVLSMARSMMKDSASSQFFIVHQDAPHLDGEYAAFGKLVYGFETLDEIANAATDARDKPQQEVKMEKVFFVKAE